MLNCLAHRPTHCPLALQVFCCLSRVSSSAVRTQKPFRPIMCEPWLHPDARVGRAGARAGLRAAGGPGHAAHDRCCAHGRRRACCRPGTHPISCPAQCHEPMPACDAVVHAARQAAQASNCPVHCITDLACSRCRPACCRLEPWSLVIQPTLPPACMRSYCACFEPAMVTPVAQYF